MKNSTLVLLLLILCICLTSCGAQEGGNEIAEAVKTIKDPTERGLSWVAISIMIHGVLNLFK